MTDSTGRHNPACVDCKHFYRLDDETGQCRRHAPRPAVYAMDAHGDVIGPDWPPTLVGDWCGEFYLDETVLQEIEQ